MSFPVRYDSPGRRCLSSRDAPGCVALKDACLLLFEGAENAGICACRNARGTSSPSVHGECRAWDAHFDQPRRGQRNPLGDFLANFLVANHEQLGVQCVIWNRRIWSVTKPYWRTYSGTNPHLDHVHVELNWPGARGLIGAVVIAAYNAWKGNRPSDAKPLPEEDVMPFARFTHYLTVFEVHSGVQLPVPNEGVLGHISHGKYVSGTQVPEHDVNTDGLTGTPVVTFPGNPTYPAEKASAPGAPVVETLHEYLRRAEPKGPLGAAA